MNKEMYLKCFIFEVKALYLATARPLSLDENSEME